MDTFDINTYTLAPLQIEASIQFQGKSPEEVFEILGDPKLIPQWFLLAKEVKIHPQGENGKTNFNVEFAFFGDVFEQVLDWNPPTRYLYSAKGKDFPIKDYVASFEIERSKKNGGTLFWKIYFSQIEGAHYQNILPVILSPIIEQSFKNLCPLIGGIESSIINN